VLAAGREQGLLLRDAGDGFWRRAAGCDGLEVQSIDFAVEPATNARLLVAAGWVPGVGPRLALSRGVMAGAPAAACEWAARGVPVASPSTAKQDQQQQAATGMGACVARVDPFDPQRLYVLTLPAAAADALWVSPDLGATWRPLAEPLLAQIRQTSCALAAAGGSYGEGGGVRLGGLALSGTRRGRLLLTGSAPAPLGHGQVPVSDGGAGLCVGGTACGPPPAAPLVLASADGGASFTDLSAAVGRALEPARERHRQHQQQHPGHAAHCRHHLAGAAAAAPLPLFVHSMAVLGFGDGQLLFNADVEAGGPWHTVCQLPGAVTALSGDDGMAAPSSLVARGGGQ
jgi:hypothetical protein